jgi:hypothetical protein
MSDNQDTMAAEEFKASFGDPSTAAEPTTPEGGDPKKKKADVKKAVDPKADKVDAVTPGQGAVKEEAETEEVEIVEEEVISIDESVAAMFEGMDISEDFKKKATVVFEAAVNEAATAKAEAIIAEKTEELEKSLDEQVQETVDTMVENLDSYLDYVVEEWMKENELAIESGIKVEMAESLMDGLRGLFEEHNIEVDDEVVDVVAGLEEQVDELKEEANKRIDENLALAKEIAGFKAAKVFDELSEDLTMTQRERLKVLSEKLDFDDIEDYTSNLNILKESFFTEQKAVTEETETEEEEIITEEAEVKKPVSDYSSINALVEALNSKK